MEIIQSILFKKEDFKIETAKKWLKKHHFKFDDIDTEKPNYIHFRQADPEPLEAQHYKFRIKKITDNILFVLAYPPNKEGGSIASRLVDTTKTIIDVGKKLIFGRNDYQPSSLKVLEKYKNNKIVKIELHRAVLSDIYMNIMNIWTDNELDKRLENEPKDNLFHISIWVTLDNGTVLRLEKGPEIHINESPKLQKFEEEAHHVQNIPQNLTLENMLNKTYEHMGRDKYFGYLATHNNCGNFIEGILDANHIGTPNDRAFIEQDARTVLSGYPNLRKTLNTITTIGEKADILYQGGRVRSVVFA
jgi:hypothetical protein